LVREQNRVVNVLRALVYNTNLTVRRGSLSQSAREKIAAVQLSGELSEIRDELLDRYEQLSRRIGQLDGKISCWAETNEKARRLMTVPGIGATTALCLVLTVGPIERFASARKLTAYVGLDVMEYSSNHRQRPGALDRSANRGIGCCGFYWVSAPPVRLAATPGCGGYSCV
jgi:transposase